MVVFLCAVAVLLRPPRTLPEPVDADGGDEGPVLADDTPTADHVELPSEAHVFAGRTDDDLDRSGLDDAGEVDTGESQHVGGEHEDDSG